jgi:hypothetical protein
MDGREVVVNRLALALTVFVSLLVADRVSAAADHPRLLFSKADVPALRQRVKQEPYASMVKRLIADLEADNMAAGPMKAGEGGYDDVTAAQRAGFLFVLTGDEEYARKARGWVESCINNKSWGNKGTKGLSLYYIGKGVALTYDWCHGSKAWDDAFSATVSKKLLEQAEVVFSNGGREQNGNPASNWQGLRWSTAGLMYLATDEPWEAKKLADCFGRVRRYVVENMGDGADSRGWNCEGLGYTFYPFGNGVAPFAVAAYLNDPKMDLRTVSAGTKWSLWTCYAALVKNAEGSMLRPDFGDDNPGTAGEGCYGFAFWFAPPELQPGLAYWYDRTVGGKGNGTYDNARLGTIASILFHPGGKVKEQDPLKIPLWRSGFVDTGGNGFFTYRNAYEGVGDVVAQLYVKLRGDRGHSGPDALSFRIVGQNTIWATGGGRYGPKSNGQDVYQRSMNTLYPVDPDERFKVNGNSGRVVGKPTINADGSGAVVANIKQNNVGTTNHTRRFVSSFDGALGARAAFVVSDTSDDGKFWQMVTLATNEITTDGNTFTVAGPDGSTLRGTVLYPASGVKFTTGKRARGSKAGDVEENNFVHFTSDDGSYLVVLTIADKGKPHPAITADGSWAKNPSGTVKVGGWSVKIDGDAVTAK